MNPFNWIAEQGCLALVNLVRREAPGAYNSLTLRQKVMVGVALVAALLGVVSYADKDLKIEEPMCNHAFAAFRATASVLTCKSEGEAADGLREAQGKLATAEESLQACRAKLNTDLEQMKKIATEKVPKFELNGRVIVGPLGESYKVMRRRYTGLAGKNVDVRMRVYFLGTPDPDDYVEVVLSSGSNLEKERLRVKYDPPSAECKPLENIQLKKFGTATLPFTAPVVPVFAVQEFLDFICAEDELVVTVHTQMNQEIFDEAIGIELLSVKLTDSGETPDLDYGWNFVFAGQQHPHRLALGN